MSIANLTVVANVEGSTAAFPSGFFCANTLTTFLNTVIVGNSGGTSETNASSCSGAAISGDAFVGATGSDEDLSTCTLAQIFADPTNGDYRPKKERRAVHARRPRRHQRRC